MLEKILVALYIVKQKKWKIFDEKNAIIMKQSHADKFYSNTCRVKILNSFNPELQLKILNM